MSWFGKLLGGTIGLMMGGPLGAIAGGALGHHLFDRDASGVRQAGGLSGRQSQLDQRRAAYFLTLFSLLGKLAKADGQVTRKEGDLVLSFLDRMHVYGEPRAFAIRVFNEAKDSPHTAEDLARQFAHFTVGQPHLRSTMLDMLFQIALADGSLHPAEEEMIRRIAAILGVSEAEMDALHSHYVGTTDKAYSVLGLTSDADDETVKKTYRRLVHEYHPDRIVSKGMPQEFVDFATDHFQKIQTAWDQIRQERNL
ncbi:MAG: TerB family tellurite resistance protein [Alkalispirochaeta sp.]|jgi:DnaJ like chaperone protein